MYGVILIVIGAVSGLFGLAALSAPTVFFETIPGLAMMGGYNVHLVRDVGLALLASGAVMAWGGWRRDAALAAAGALWPVLHALFHLQLWTARGLALDVVFWFDLAAVFLPNALAVWAILRLRDA